MLSLTGEALGGGPHVRRDRYWSKTGGWAVRGRLRWSLAVLVVAVTFGVGVGVQQWIAKVRPTSSTTTTVTAVFYSGEGCAGLPQAGAAARRLRAQRAPCVPGFNGGTGFYNGRWTSDTPCDPSHATYPAAIGGHTVTQLVGFSLGRLGPLYLLRASSSLTSNVNSIIMLDPGSSEISSNACDTQHDSAGLLHAWLARSPSNRLTIIAGRDTQTENYAGINNVYLSSLSQPTRNAQVLVCAVNLAHADVMAQYGPRLIGKPPVSSCPSGASPSDTASPTHGSGGSTGSSSAGTPPNGGGTIAPTTNGMINIGWSSAHPSWITMTLDGLPAGSYQYTCNFGSGGPAIFTVSLSGSTQTIDNGRTCQDGAPGDTVWVTIGSARSNTLTVATRPGGAGSGSGSPPPPASASVQIGWSEAHPTWLVMTLTGFNPGSYQYTCNFASGGPQSYTVGVSTSPQTWDNGHTCFDAIGGDRVWVTIGSTNSNTLKVPGAPPPPPPPPSPTTYAETVGGPTSTWTNYTNAGGTRGQTIANGQTVQVVCVVQGFRVADGDTYWYRIAQSPWNNAYYASADAFYNNGATSGSLHGTPFVDPAVPSC